MRNGNKSGRPAAGVAANDNGSAEARVQAAVLTLARLLGRQIAREQFTQLHAANDNRSADGAGAPLTRQE